MTDSYRDVPLSGGRTVALVDAADFALVSQWKWHVCNGYAARSVYIPETQGSRMVLMHRFLLGISNPKIVVDHINCQTLDNRRANLRPATKSQNTAYQAKPRRGSSPYRGVSRSGKRNKPWQGSICVNQRNKSLGTFLTEEEAAHAYDRAARDAFGSFARLNFPENSR